MGGMRVDFELTEEQQLLAQTVRRFALEQVLPHARRWDRDEQFPHAVVRELGQMGLMGINVEPNLGGSGLGSTEAAIVVEELAKVDGSLALTVSSHNGLCCGHIRLFGSPVQKARFLPPLASGEKLGAWCLTEPKSGSDAAAMVTQARRVGGDWVIDGEKTFITQGSVAETFVVMARTDSTKKNHGITAFVLEKGTKGFGQEPIKHKLGMRSSDTAVLTFDTVHVPDSQRLGSEGEGFLQALRVLDRSRISVGALALGLGRGAMAAARAYALERKQFGRLLADFQAIQWKLADMATELDAASMLVYRAAAQCDAQKPFHEQAAMA
jgi:alkylation response protein AidB-like acyl-CoA dehydrogenase